MLRTVLLVETGWTWLYTAGMAPEIADRRREEIAAHSRDFHEWLLVASVQHRRAAVVHALTQFVFGIPSDIGWRAQCGRAAFSVRAVAEAFLGGVMLAGFLLLFPAAFALGIQYRGAGEPTAFLSVATAILLVAAMLLLIAPGLLAMERWPAAGTALVVLGVACVTIVLWWFIPAVVLGLAGMVGALVGGRRMRAPVDN